MRANKKRGFPCAQVRYIFPIIMNNKEIFKRENFSDSGATEHSRAWKTLGKFMKVGNKYILKGINSRLRKVLFYQCFQIVQKPFNQIYQLIIRPWLQNLCEKQKRQRK